MKTYYVPTLLLLLSFSCANKKQASLPLPESVDQQWATFEGKILSSQGEVIDVELSLQESSPGVSSFYRLNGIVVADQYTSMIQSRGQYEVTPLGDGLFGIRLLGKETGQPASSGAFFKRNIPHLRNVPTRPNGYFTTDFYFTTRGDGRLALADEDFNRMSTDDRYTVFKRSRLFTVEGYVTLEPDGSLEFFERNTFDDWRVSHLGMYQVLKESYINLAKEPWEGIYVRAVAYSVSDTTDRAGQSGNLVVKTLIAMGDSH